MTTATVVVTATRTLPDAMKSTTNTKAKTPPPCWRGDVWGVEINEGIHRVGRGDR